MGNKTAKPLPAPTRFAPPSSSNASRRRINRMEDFNAEYVHSCIRVANKTNQSQTCVIKGARVQAKISSFLAEVELEIRFANETGSPMEAVFKFLTTNEVMYAFEVVVGSKVIKGVCKEKAQARQEYDDAIASGKGAYLAEENATEERKSFDIAVGNLPHGQSCTVKISYAQELSHLGTRVIFALPVTNAFGAAESANASADLTEASRGASETKKELSGFSFSADIVMGSNITAVEAAGCETKLEGKTGSATASGLAYPGHRVEVIVDVEDPYSSSAIVEEFPGNPKNKAIMLSLFPKIDTEVDSVTEMIFLIDRSGSMSSKISQVRNAMQLFLRSIPLGTLFNIIGFGSNFVRLFENSRAFDDKVMKSAIAHVSEIEADLGGTELYRPLSFVMSQPVEKKFPRQIFVLTDGAVSNAGLVLDYVRDNIGLETRIFTLGIGSGASEVLVQGIAHLGNGLAQRVDNRSRLERPIMALVTRALTPIIVGVEPYWGDFTVLPRPIERYTRPVFDGQKLVAYDFLDPKAVQPDSGSVVVKMIATTSAGEKITFTASVDASKGVVQGSSIHRLAATSIIRDLESGENEIEKNGGKKDTHKDAIVERALEYTVASKHTSFVAIEERDEPVLDDMKKVDVAKQLGEDHMDEIENKRVGAPPAADLDRVLEDQEESRSAAPAAEKRREKDSDKKEKKKLSSASFASRKRKMSDSDDYVKEPESPVYRVVLLAGADGSFEMAKQLAEAIGLEEEAIRKSPENVGEKVWATLLAILFMELKCFDAKEEWWLLHKKSVKFVQESLASAKKKVATHSYEELRELAKKLFDAAGL